MKPLRFGSWVALFGAVCLSWTMFSCKGGDNPPADAFDRRAMLEWYADELIIPSYETLQSRLEDLQGSVQALVENPNPGTLVVAKGHWRKAYLAWQDANAFNFGPAGEAGTRKSLAEELGTFPTNTALIDQLAAAGDTTFANFNRDTRGLMALSYLLFDGFNTLDVVLDKMNDPNYRAYVLGVTNNALGQVNQVVAAWRGGYRAEFIANDGADVGSSVSSLYNEFVRSYEQLKNFKLGLPLGKRVGQTGVEPMKVEAYHSLQSGEGLKAHFQSLVRIWEGRNLDGVTGPGFRDYLASVEGGNELITNTEAQIFVVNQRLDQLGTAMEFTIESDPGLLEPLFAALSQHTRFWKSDMASLLGISITFVDGDGD